MPQVLAVQMVLNGFLGTKKYLKVCFLITVNSIYITDMKSHPQQSAVLRLLSGCHHRMSNS